RRSARMERIHDIRNPLLAHTPYLQNGPVFEETGFCTLLDWYIGHPFLCHSDVLGSCGTRVDVEGIYTRRRIEVSQFPGDDLADHSDAHVARHWRSVLPKRGTAVDV